MKKYIYVFSIFSLIGSCTDVVADFGKTVEACVVFGILDGNGVDRKVTTRGLRHAMFYSPKRANDFFSQDNALDYIVYPIVDVAIGQGMSKLNSVEPINALTKNISKDNKEFLANNVQLIASAGIIKAIRIDSQKGISNVNGNDIKNFGKNCAMQVGCDAVEEFIVEPAVRKLVKDQNSWTALGLRLVGYGVLAEIIKNNVSKF
jgi:hypothetical protein